MLIDYSIPENFRDMTEFFDGDFADAKYPGLFCDTTWMHEVAGTDTARDDEGNEIYINNVPQTINKLYAERLGNGNVPFWADLMKAYEFGPADEGPAFCTNNEGTKGATSSLTGWGGNKVAVSLCPLAFDGEDGKDLEVLPPSDTTDLVDATGEAFADGTPLFRVTPKSATLYHEAFHAVFEGDFLGGSEEICTSSCFLRRVPSSSWAEPTLVGR